MNVITNQALGRIDASTYEQKVPTASRDLLTERTSAASNQDLGTNQRLKEAEQKQKLDVNRLTDKEKESLFEELQKHNEKFEYTGKFLRFRYNEEAEATYVEVVNASTQEVIVSLPPEFLIDLSVKMKKLVGMFIDKKL